MKLIDVTAPLGNADTLRGLAEQHQSLDVRVFPQTDDGLQSLRLIVSDDRAQPVLDSLQSVLGAQKGGLIGVVTLETVLPRPPEQERKVEDSATTTREALFDAVERDARQGGTFVVLVLLSTVVAAVGLVKVNVAVVIAAMVIAPLLAANLAASVVFLAKGINPRTWWEKARARRATGVYIVVWVVILAVLVGVIVARRELG